MGIIDLLKNATAIFFNEKKVSASLLQRKLELDYNFANILLEELELIGIVSSYNTGERRLLISSMEEFEKKTGEYYRSMFPVAKDESEDEDVSSNDPKKEFEMEIINDEIVNNKKANSKSEKIGEHHFESSVSRGGELLFPEHIYINDFEVTWEKKSGVFSKDSITIPILEVTQIEIKTTLINASIIIRSKGYGNIKGEHFTKSDVSLIKELIETAKKVIKDSFN